MMRITQKISTQFIFPCILILLPACGGGNDTSGNEQPIGDSSCITERANLELSIHNNLNNITTDADFTLLIAADDGRRFEHSIGNSSPQISYRSASTSKFVTAAVILSLVESGDLSLTDQPQDYIQDWPTTGNLANINLAHLLSFTSGLNNKALCVDYPNADPAACVYSALINNLSNSKVGGEEFYYSSSHMQVAGMMAINALEVDSWQDVFTLFKNRTGLFSNSTYDLPSSTNPRLAGGMHWTADEYFEFLKAIYKQTILTPELIMQMTSDQIANSIITNSPVINGLSEDWHYGFGNWIECHSENFNCSQVTRVSSPGAYGAYPFIDFANNYYGILAREGDVGTFPEGYAVFISVAEQLELWMGMSCESL